MLRKQLNQSQNQLQAKSARKACQKKGDETASIADVGFHSQPQNEKPCSQRFLNRLSSHFSKSDWTVEEQHLFIKLFLLLGNKWSLIARAFEGRSQNSVKNYFYSTLRMARRRLNKRLDQSRVEGLVQIEDFLLSQIISYSVIRKSTCQLTRLAKQFIVSVMSLYMRNCAARRSENDFQNCIQILLRFKASAIGNQLENNKLNAKIQEEGFNSRFLAVTLVSSQDWDAGSVPYNSR